MAVQPVRRAGCAGQKPVQRAEQVAADEGGPPAPPPGSEDGSVSAHARPGPAGVDEHGRQALLFSSGDHDTLQEPNPCTLCELCTGYQLCM